MKMLAAGFEDPDGSSHPHGSKICSANLLVLQVLTDLSDSDEPLGTRRGESKLSLLHSLRLSPRRPQFRFTKISF